MPRKQNTRQSQALSQGLDEVCYIGLSAAASNATTTLVLLDDLCFPVVQPGEYRFEYVLAFSTNLATSPPVFRVSFTGTTTNFIAMGSISQTTGTGATAARNTVAAGASPLNLQGPTSGNTTATIMPAWIQGSMVVTVAGALQLSFAPAAAASSISVSAGSFGVMQRNAAPNE